ncbi:ArsR/SmtB family transcription factor [Couchioplanes azureus]|uniref:ArsR/SmtB family transcription factor n=1 Tax=Couchioplanes caeruleus TaxID=56438 RepID=UPI0016712C42|nr:winged helix-turn-helix domain-containing protein [Couchioplanes caeruleus]GGQ85266.1 transcriptional regulator [Couchioplanes caeruleus subsp. azureus]
MGKGTLSIVFNAQDMARTTVQESADPMWELVFSLHRLQTEVGYLNHLDWHRQVRHDIRATGLAPLLRSTLLPLMPLSSYFPDFLTPSTGSGEIEEVIDIIAGTPGAQLRRQVETMIARGRKLPSWTADLAAGQPAARRHLSQGLQRYFDIAVRPHWPAIGRRVTEHRLVRQTGVLQDGMGSLLSGLSPSMRWQPPVLQVHGYPRDRRLVLQGRGITLIPSYFCQGNPVALADPALEPVLVYPAPREESGPVGPGLSPDGVDVLLGRTRAAILRAASLGTSTTELARCTGTSPATASHHTAVLRKAGLLTSHRMGKQTLHRITDLGRRLAGA